MESLRVCFNAVLPIFLLLALGYTARCTGVIRRETVPAINKVIFRFFMSVTMFYNIYQSDLSELIRPKILLFGTAGVLVTYGLAVGWVFLTEPSREKRGVKIQGIYRSNFLLLGLPLVQSLAQGQDLGAVMVLLAVEIPLENLLAVITLVAFRGERLHPEQVIVRIIKNPMVIGAAAGVAALVLSVRLPAVLETTVRQMAGVSSPLMLFLLGAFFRFDGLKRYKKDLGEVCLIRLVIVPALVLPAAYLLGIRGAAFAGMIGLFGAPTAVASFAMVQELGGDDELAGDIVIAESALCVVTIFLWSWLFCELGAF